MSPPLRDPGSVGSTSQWRASGCLGPRAHERQYAVSLSVGDVEEPGDAIHRRDRRRRRLPRRTERRPLRDQFADPGPPFAQRRVRPALPRHLPPCLGAGQRPGDGDNVGSIVEPDRGTDEDVAQRHPAGAGPGRVLGKVGVDELSWRIRAWSPPCRRRIPDRQPWPERSRRDSSGDSRPTGAQPSSDRTQAPAVGLRVRCRAWASS